MRRKGKEIRSLLVEYTPVVALRSSLTMRISGHERIYTFDYEVAVRASVPEAVYTDSLYRKVGRERLRFCWYLDVP